MAMLGIVGGMGPLASAEFLKTLYEHNLSELREQDAPRVIMYSDPSFPDRSEALLNGNSQPLLANLTAALLRLQEMGTAENILCCITCHHLLPQLPNSLRRPVISLIDLIFNQILEQPGKYLLVCIKGTRQLNLFQNHALWQLTKDRIILLDQPDQAAIHRLIYQLKRNTICHRMALRSLERLKHRYQADYLIAGCTEMHLLNKYALSRKFFAQTVFLDPLVIAAQTLGSRSLEAVG